MPHTTLPYAQPANVATTFSIQLQDAPGTTAQASERAYGWAGNRVEVIRADGTPRVVPPNASGVALVDASGNRQGTLTNVTRVGTSRSSVIYRKVSGGGAPITPGTPHTVVLSARLRMSIWATAQPFCVALKGSDITLDAGLLKLLGEARVDDLSLVKTIGWETRAKGSKRAKPPRWHDGFIPLGSVAHREPYLRRLIDALHGMKVQVIPGFALAKSSTQEGELPHKVQEYEDRVRDFVDWLSNASSTDLADYAASINHFFESRGLDVDGIGFNIEVDEVKSGHRDKLALLYSKVSEAMAHRNGLVSYATGPFLEDGVYPRMNWLEAQPFSTAAAAPNLLARPMCYGKANGVVRSHPLQRIKDSVDTALRPRKVSLKDKTPQGGGLHPSQVQFAILARDIEGGVAQFSTTVLRRNRIGLMLYVLPDKRENVVRFLEDCRTWNDALNPGEGPQGQDGLPLQVPRGYGDWPVQRARPVQGPGAPRP